jgi:hypothetical protein
MKLTGHSNGRADSRSGLILNGLSEELSDWVGKENIRLFGLQYSGPL